VQLFRHQQPLPRSARAPQRGGHQGGLHVAGLGVQEGLPYVFGQDQPGLELVPQPQGLQRLTRGRPVRGKLRVGDGDPPDLRAGQVLQAVEPQLEAVQGQAPAGVDLQAPRGEQALPLQLLNRLGVRGDEQVHRGALLDLPGQRARAPEVESHPHPAAALEGPRGLAQGEAQAGGG